ncbi:hypothetical protein ACFV2Z_22450 [Streptomyces sp. NPDC059688]|uniref:hypothetical protein n=1 Tax=Streptomyces sp. NPDC059688 TaxID=3346906 RepID=UPI00368625E1
MVESLCLQALAGQAVLITVTSARTPLLPGWYDVVVGATTDWALDLYGGVDDVDTAAGILAEALTGDLAALQPEGDGQRTAAALALLLGPWRALHGRFPSVVELPFKQAQARAKEVAESSGRFAASERLQKAWIAVYGRHPDPGAAYRHAVAAVEDVACPLFLPRDASPTLGKVRAHLANSAHKYAMVISDSNGAPASIDAVTALVGLLWHGQRDRHEGGPTSAPITQEAAEHAVHLACLLVTTIGGHAVRRLP